MTFDQAVALSLLPSLARARLAERLRGDDPELLELAAPALDAGRRAREKAAAGGIHAVPWNSPEYPTPLLALQDFPPALWYRGRLEALRTPMVAIVGSRAASAVALETALRLGIDLAGAGVTVVSGLARGVDSAAHRGALRAGLTVAVLGSGPDIIYPREHTTLSHEIAAAGVVLSEYPPGVPPAPFNFPHRNRLISGLSRAVVIVEASERSGSLITASCALEQGREVMAVPGNVLSGRNRGAHALIRDGAKIVETADDILQDLGLSSAAAGAPVGGVKNCERTGCADPVLRAMAPGEAYDLDALAVASGVDGARLLPRLLDLELRGLVRRIAGGRFMRSA